jgi:acetylornithine deacetylase
VSPQQRILAAENAHALDERVSLPSLLRVTKTIALFAAEWCGADVGE